MAEWKKVIVSGSNADLADVSASGNFLGNLIGNATGDLTGNADTATALANARTINGTSFDGTGNITLGNDSVTEAMMADNSIDSGAYVDASIDTAHIADEQVTLAKLAHAAANTVMVRDANSAGDPSFKAVTNTQILIGDGTGFTAAALSGDVTMTNAGVVTIGAGTVENSMLADDAVGADELAANAVVNASIASGAAIAHSKLASLASTKVLVGNGSNVATGVALSGDVTMDNAGAVTIANTAVETAMIAADAVTAAKLADDAVVTANIVDANVTRAKIGNDAINGDKIADDSIDSEHYADGSIDTAHIADNAVDGDKLADDIVIAGALTVTGDLLVSGDSVTVNTANLNVEDPFILLKSGSSNTSDSGIIFGGSTGTANTGKAIVWDASYNSNDGRLAVSTTAVAGDATANFGAGTAGYYVAGVFEGTEANAATAKADHAGNIRIESSEIFIYV